ncbi:GNAT family N-acetyltransferase [Rothia kristinae]|uniref:GNAT family N-acetyltransferase n=1 Tax=Rothia kristinae TaxID=37923 RepID=A0A7T3F9S2_9MICC|nr:GNAT family N-acetyltransferase [Rothia kristinae]QPT53935.1 GNAT family N-acetyltransferase [Rothia kristinae]WGH09837.1 GNAT family N-acetyltransferase [Rothia kristinae]
MDICATRALERAELIRLYDAVGWSAYTREPELFDPMIDGAWLVLSAWDEDRLVGLVRMVGDGATVACIQDLLVLPEHQGRGIGRALLGRALQACAGIRQIYITTDDAAENQRVIDLYRSLGFRATSEMGLTTLTLQR